MKTEVEITQNGENCDESKTDDKYCWRCQKEMTGLTTYKPEEMTSKDYYFDSYAHFGIHEVSLLFLFFMKTHFQNCDINYILII